MTKPTKRGGARPGAGRRGIGVEHRMSVSLTAVQRATAQRLGAGEQSAGIRAALDAQVTDEDRRMAKSTEATQ